MTADDTPRKAGPREWIGLGALALATLAVSFDVFVLLLALPHLSTSLGAGATQQLWIVDIYGFMVGGFLITAGSLGDRIGRRRLLLIGAAGFGIASVLSAYATDPVMLIAARALLGVAGATLAPSTLALISTMFGDDRQRALAIGIWAGCFTAGAIIGPVAGAVLLESFWWGSVFLLAVPAMALLLLVVPFVVPESRNPDAGRLDLASVALSLAAVLPAVYGIKELVRYGWRPLPLVALVVGLAFGAVFVRRQRRLADPLLDLRLFANPTLTVTLVAALLYTMLTGTTLVFVTQYFQSVDGLSPLQSALGLIPGMAVSTVSMLVAPILARRFRPGHLIAGGLAVVVAGLLILTQADAASGSAPLVTGFAVWCLGGGPLLALGTHLIVGAAPPEKAGSASSLTQVSSEFGYSLGIATVGTLGVAVYRAQIEVPGAVPPAAATAARENIDGAVAAAGRVPAELGEQLLAAARDAFTTSLNSVAAVSAAVMAVVTVVALVRLRHTPPLGAQPEAAGPDAAGTAGDTADGSAEKAAAGQV
ncbi:MFS transporter [Microbispora sp. GKU 823]|uniref:MFS transporter n=1 Tax=Microbispora sp. GKU 823 TaxID=1652100 RepID=UPI0009A39EDE|nr:MFS transporter [Microbispora sp. GKU 823]OPG07017.1 MFS transporter [Microbispora sp. GKU 823]